MSSSHTFRARFPQHLDNRETAPVFEALEPRVLMSAAILSVLNPVFEFVDKDGDPVRVEFSGPGVAGVELERNRKDRADLYEIDVRGATAETTVKLTLQSGTTNIVKPNVAVGDGRFIIDSNGGLLTFGEEYRRPVLLPPAASGAGAGAFSIVDSIDADFEPGPITWNEVSANLLGYRHVTLADGDSFEYQDKRGGSAALTLTGPGEATVRLFRYVRSPSASGSDVLSLDTISFTGTTEETIFEMNTSGPVTGGTTVTYPAIGELRITTTADQRFGIGRINGSPYRAGFFDADGSIAPQHPDVRHTYTVLQGHGLHMRDASGDPLKLDINSDFHAIMQLEGGASDGADIASIEVFDEGWGTPRLVMDMDLRGDGTGIGELIIPSGRMELTTGHTVRLDALNGAAFTGASPFVDVTYRVLRQNGGPNFTDASGDLVGLRLPGDDVHDGTIAVVRLMGGAAWGADIDSIQIQSPSPRPALHVMVRTGEGSDGAVSWRTLQFSEPFGGVLVYNDEAYPAAFGDAPAYTLHSGKPLRLLDTSGDVVTVALRGPGSADIYLDQQVAMAADIARIELTGTIDASRLTISSTGRSGTYLGLIEGDGSLRDLTLRNVRLTGGGVHLAGSLGAFRGTTLMHSADIITGAAAPRGTTIRLDEGVTGVSWATPEPSIIHIEGTLKKLTVPARYDLWDTDLHAQQIVSINVGANIVRSNISSSGDIGSAKIGGGLSHSTLLAGGSMIGEGSFTPAHIGDVRIKDNLSYSVIGAGVDPGDDGLFDVADALLGGTIGRLEVGGIIWGPYTSEVDESTAGVYASDIGTLKVGRHDITSMQQLIKNDLLTGRAIVHVL